MTNPFSHSGIVTGEAFCNRVQELKDLVYMARHAQNVMLYSHRRTGKTSLIHQLMLKLKKKRPRIDGIYIDLYGTIDERDFIEAVFTGLTQIESKVERLFKLASGLKMSGTVDPLTGQPSMSVFMRADDRPKYFDNAMQALAGYAAKHKLLVVFDEFQEIAKYTESGFEKRLRAHIQQHINIAYIFSGSQKHILNQMFNASNRAFYHMATSYPLRPISMGDYVKWASAIFHKRDMNLDETIIRDIVVRCNFQPMYIQQFLFEIYRLDAIDPEAINRLELKILQRRENEFIILWDSLTVNQRKALRLLADTGGEGIYYADVLQRFGLKSGSLLKRALTSLVTRDVVTKNQTHHIQDAMLKKWVQRTMTG